MNTLLTRMNFGDEKNCNSFVSQVFVADIELEDLIHAGGKHSVLYCDTTEAELQNQLLENSTLQSHIFTPLGSQ